MKKFLEKTWDKNKELIVFILLGILYLIITSFSGYSKLCEKKCEKYYGYDDRIDCLDECESDKRDANLEEQYGL